MKIPKRTGVTALSAPDSPPSGRRRAALVAGLIATGLISSSVVVPGLGAAAPAEFPNNLVVFPNRDFVTVEGYQDRIGQEALIEVKRADKVIGSAKVKVADGGDPGGVAFEVNHPGGACWGAGTDLQVTPDILPGDVVGISFNGVPAGDTTVADTYVTGSSLGSDGTTLTVTGHIGDSVNKTQLEQRIVNPDLTGTDVNRRDARAVTGGPAAAPKGGYVSNLVVNNDKTFTAIYQFTTPATATIAASGGGERMMSWQVEDAAANRQGLTIAELGELGGPGMGGCPAGATQIGPVGPTNVTAVRSADKTSVRLGWTPAAGITGTAAITGYRVTAVDGTVTGKEQVELGRRIADPSANQTTIGGLDPTHNYTYEIRSVSAVGETFPPSVPGAGGSTTNGSGDADVTKPTVTATVSGSAITFSSNEATASIYYTTGPGPDGVDVFTAGGTALSPVATLFRAGTTVPVPPTGTVLKFAAVDLADNVSNPTTGTVFGGGTTSAPLPTAVTNLTATAKQGAVDLAWASTDTTVTGYTVRTYDVATGGLPIGTAIDTAAKTATVGGLTANKDYWFTVTPRNANGAGPESVRASARPTTVTDTVTVARATFKANDFRVVGSSTATSGTVSVYRVDPRTNPTAPAITGMANVPLAAAAAPATGTTFDIRLRNTAGITQPATVWVKSSNGGVGQLAVRNG